LKQVENLKKLFKINEIHQGRFFPTKTFNHRISKTIKVQRVLTESKSRFPRSAEDEYFDTEQAENNANLLSAFGNVTIEELSRSPQLAIGKQTPFTQAQLNSNNSLGVIQSFEFQNSNFNNLGDSDLVLNKIVESPTQSESAESHNNNQSNVGITARTTTIAIPDFQSEKKTNQDFTILGSTSTTPISSLQQQKTNSKKTDGTESTTNGQVSEPQNVNNNNFNNVGTTVGSTAPIAFRAFESQDNKSGTAGTANNSKLNNVEGTTSSTRPIPDIRKKQNKKNKTNNNESTNTTTSLAFQPQDINNNNFNNVQTTVGGTTTTPGISAIQSQRFNDDNFKGFQPSTISAFEQQSNNITADGSSADTSAFQPQNTNSNNLNNVENAIATTISAFQQQNIKNSSFNNNNLNNVGTASPAFGQTTFPITLVTNQVTAIETRSTSRPTTQQATLTIPVTTPRPLPSPTSTTPLSTTPTCNYVQTCDQVVTGRNLQYRTILRVIQN